MAFIPATVRIHAYFDCLRMSTSQYKKERISSTHPPDTSANDEVLMRLMTGE